MHPDGEASPAEQWVWRGEQQGDQGKRRCTFWPFTRMCQLEASSIGSVPPTLLKFQPSQAGAGGVAQVSAARLEHCVESPSGCNAQRGTGYK